jgi:hypothetical protein
VRDDDIISSHPHIKIRNARIPWIPDAPVPISVVNHLKMASGSIHPPRPTFSLYAKNYFKTRTFHIMSIIFGKGRKPSTRSSSTQPIWQENTLSRRSYLNSKLWKLPKLSYYQSLNLNFSDRSLTPFAFSPGKKCKKQRGKVLGRVRLNRHDNFISR